MFNIESPKVERFLTILERAVLVLEANTAEWTLERARKDEEIRKEKDN